ncbi:MAG: polysaccharide deacetylase family protein [Pseudomonadota bacterium]
MPNPNSFKLLISLHDVTPFHSDRLEKAESLFRDLCLEKVTYLLVPRYHGSYLCTDSPRFIEWCRAERTFRIEWHLHGYHHLEVFREPGGNAGRIAPGDRWKRKYLTAGEAEFLTLSADEMRDKLDSGRGIFRACLKMEPRGFVAPAWLFDSGLPAALKARGIRYTEDHRRLYELESGRTSPSPVITWATRTLIRKYGSLVVCPLLACLWASAPVLRVAIHPFDFDHAATVANIRGVLRRLQKIRTQVFRNDLV